MGLLNVIKRTLGFKTRRTWTRKKLARAKYTKRNAEYWGRDAVTQNNTPVEKRERKRFNLSELILLVLNEHPHKAMTIDDIRKGVGKLRGFGVSQSHASVGINIAALTKEGKAERVVRGFYKAAK